VGRLLVDDPILHRIPMPSCERGLRFVKAFSAAFSAKRIDRPGASHGFAPVSAMGHAGCGGVV
jgi:hypothetical protein